MNRIAKVAIRHWKLLVIYNAVLLAITYANIKFTPRIWTTKAQLILPNVTSDLDADLGKLGKFKEGEIVFSQQLNPLKILSSIALSDHVIKKVWQGDPEKNKYQIFSDYKTLFKMTPESESTVISLSVQGSNPELARQRAKLLIVAFRDRLQELREDEAIQRSRFIQREVKQAQQKLLQAQRDLTEFQASSSLVSSKEQTQELIATINNLQRERSQALSEAKANAEKVQKLSQRLNLAPNAAIQSARLAENKEYQFIRQKLSEIEANLTQLQSKFTNDHPQVRDLQSQREVLRRQLDRQIADTAGNVTRVDTKAGENTASLIKEQVLAESQGAAMQKKAEQLQTQLQQLQTQLKSLPAQQERLQQLQSRYEIAEGVYHGVVAQAEQAKLGAFSAYPSVQVLDQPNVELQPSNPKPKLMLLGGLLGSVFGSAAIILFMESRNPSLSPKDIQQTKIPVLASIPHIKALVMKIEQQIAEEIEFQRLASAISLLPLEKGRLMIASATSGEGKTTITLGLAYALINLGFRVLIVDGDFRKAQLSQYFDYQQKVISDRELMLVNVRPYLDLLMLKAEGKTIAEFIARGEFEQHLNSAQVAENYDYVLIDSSPVNLTGEAVLMAKVVSNVLFVARPDTSNRNPFHNSIEQLTRHQATIVGLVINGVETRTEGYLYESNIGNS